jgi:hypothetical protein
MSGQIKCPDGVSEFPFKRQCRTNYYYTVSNPSESLKRSMSPGMILMGVSQALIRNLVRAR